MNQDLRYTTWLDSENIRYTSLPAFNLHDVDLATSLKNQARLDVALNPVKVSEYARLMRTGKAAFPPIMVCKPAEWTNGKWLIITGNHRVQAALEAGYAVFDAYHILSADTDPYVRELLIRSANVIEGDTITASERVSQAIHMMRTYQRSIKEVATAFHLHETSIAERLRAEATKERLARSGMTTERLPKGTLSKLEVVQSDVVLKDLAETIQKARIPMGMVAGLVQSVTHQGSESQQLEWLTKFRSSPEYQSTARETMGGSLKPKTVRYGFFARLSTTGHFIASHDTSLQKLGVTDAVSYQRFCEHVDALNLQFSTLRRQWPLGLTNAARDTSKSGPNKARTEVAVQASS